MTRFKSAIGLIIDYIKEYTLTSIIAFSGLLILAQVVTGIGTSTSIAASGSVAVFLSVIYGLAATYLLIGTALYRQGLTSFDVSYSKDLPVGAAIILLAVDYLCYLFLSGTLAMIGVLIVMPQTALEVSLTAATSILVAALLKSVIDIISGRISALIELKILTTIDGKPIT